MKRFTETTKWVDPWFIRLPALRKLLWMYLCDTCDASGVIDFCAELAAVQVGTDLTEDWLKDFGDRLHKLPSGKWQIVKFLKFQYGTVDARCPAHKPVIRLIEANNLRFPINNLPDRVVNRESDRVLNTLQEKEKEEDKGKPYPNPYTTKPKLPAPIYDKLPPKRDPTDAEWAEQQRIAKEEAAKFRAQHSA